MKLADFVISFLEKEGVEHVFGLTGGSVVHLFDSIDKNPNIECVFTHHEQAASFAAEAYSRVSENLGALIVTSGPGGTNAITGVAAAWLDSLPCIVISGQTRLEHTTQDKPVRQLGSQQLHVIDLVKSITNYAVMVEDPKRIKYHLQKAIYLARTGRPGPVWIDIPLNFQWIDIEPDLLPEFDPSVLEEKYESIGKTLNEDLEKCIDLIKQSKRPLILAGQGIRLGHSVNAFRELIDTLKIPFVSSWMASDLIPTKHELYMGRIGLSGQRGGNLAIQNCDLLIALGSHLSIPLTGTNFDSFAREAKRIVVDIDHVELEYETVKIDVPVCCDVKIFIKELLNKLKDTDITHNENWEAKCKLYKPLNAISSEWKKQDNLINQYVLVDTLSDLLNKDDIIVVDGGGTVVYSSFQGFKIQEGQRIILSSSIGAMGSGLPESIGACFASGKKRTICMCGDGSLQLNIQELQTIVHHNLPIKIFLFNNDGYLAIRHTQEGFLDQNYVGSDERGGMSLPNFMKVASAYGIKTKRVNNHKDLKEKLLWALNEEGPVLCEVMISRNQELSPRIGFDKNSDGTFSPRPLEDMHPYLDRKEFERLMTVKPYTKK